MKNSQGDISSLQNKIKALKEENEKIKKDLDNEKKKHKEDIENLQNQLKSCLINVSLIEQNEKILLNKDIDFMNFYDVIIDIKSIKDITDGKLK